jgi:O-antigen polysaccharide polymerase Wzy
MIDHRHLFLFGYFFYFFTPLVAGHFNLFPGYPGMELYQQFFQLIPQDKVASYTVITLLWLPAFFAGHLLFAFFKPARQQVQLFNATPLSLSTNYAAVLLVLVLVLFAFISRNSLFGGYGSYDIGARGKMSTLLVIFNFFLVYQLITNQKISKILLTGTFITALLLLSMGGRMYVFQTVVIILVYKTSFAPKRWQWHHIGLFSVAAFFAGGIAGIWRMGASVNLQRALYSFFAEPVFTWFSTSTYLINNDPPLINMPLNFLTSFLNLIPNSIISFKPYVVSTASMVKGYESPLGADSLWSNLVINFGTAGSFVFLMFTGFFLNLLRYLSAKSRFAAVYYILVLGMIPFQLFRDGFYILNKQLLFNFFFFPALILLVLKVLIYAAAKNTQLNLGAELKTSNT